MDRTIVQKNNKGREAMNNAINQLDSTDINAIENGKIIENINESQSWCFEKITKLTKL